MCVLVCVSMCVLVCSVVYLWCDGSCVLCTLCICVCSHCCVCAGSSRSQAVDGRSNPPGDPPAPGAPQLAPAAIAPVPASVLRGAGELAALFEPIIHSNKARRSSRQQQWRRSLLRPGGQSDGPPAVDRVRVCVLRAAGNGRRVISGGCQRGRRRRGPAGRPSAPPGRARSAYSCCNPY